MKRQARAAFTVFQLLVVLAILGILVGVLLSAIMKARQAASRIESINNLKQIALACHVYHDAVGNLPSGNDANNFSAHAHLLPYIEQENVFNDIDFKKPVTDKANDKARKVQIKIYLSPLDPIKEVKDGVGATNYLFCAGSKPALKDNDGVMCQDSKLTLGQITSADGTSNTLLAMETLKGDGGTRAVTVQRQHVRLKADALKGIKDDAGVKDWKDDKNIAGDRGASWMDGRFLQGTMSVNRLVNDPKPDVSCDGLGGYSGLRILNMPVVPVVWCDGHVSNLPVTTKPVVLKAIATWNGGEQVDLP